MSDTIQAMYIQPVAWICDLGSREIRQFIPSLDEEVESMLLPLALSFQFCDDDSHKLYVSIR